jgi:shikimate dehydrogenase
MGLGSGVAEPDLYRFYRFSVAIITGKTKLLGVIGDPIQHSLSPVMHNAALAVLGGGNSLDYVYLPLPVKAPDLAAAIAGLAAVNLQGFSVTLPHKQAILSYLSEVSEIAAAVGAVNTVWRTEGGWAGTNTDVAGFLAPLQSLERDWSQEEVVVLGNGGAARAVVMACAQLDVAAIYVMGRNPQKLREFEASWTHPKVVSKLRTHPWQELADLLPYAGLLVNTTPLGMYPHGDQSPLDEAEITLLSPEAIAYDLIYTPNPTRFLQQAQVRGLRVIDGLEMLVQQGAVALERWLDQPAPVEVMREAARQFLGL